MANTKAVAAAAEDFGSFLSLRLKSADGEIESKRITTAAGVIAFISAHRDVARWRVNGTIAARVGSEWRNDGWTMRRYFEDMMTSSDFAEHFRLSGHGVAQ